MSRFRALPRLGKKQTLPSWSLASLEPRLLLAADVGAPAPAAETSSETISPCTDSEHLVIIDSSIGPDDAILSSIPQDADVIVLDGSSNALEQITAALSNRHNLLSVHLLSHGHRGAIHLGDQVLSSETIGEHQSLLRSWASAFAPGGDLLLYGCETGQAAAGQTFVESLAELTGVNVAASTDRTAAVKHGGDWTLERKVGPIEHASLLAAGPLQTFNGHLGIEIIAAGSTGEERMQLQIGNEVVATYDLTGTNADANQFKTFTFDREGVNASDVRIQFINDVYDEAAGIDRNLRVDKIRIDGVTYETEAPNVLSTGTWQASVGIQPGNWSSEYLHANGYFQYQGTSTPNPTGSTIRVFASGQTGDETLQLLVDGAVVGTYDRISTAGQVITYNASQQLTADRIRVAFTNDLYDEPNGIDRNLTIDRIEIDGQVFQTEAATTYSTGTWLPADGIVPGYRQNEMLHSNGYFQYAGGTTNPPSGNPGSFSLSTSEITRREDGLTATLTVTRLNGSDGAASIDYLTVGDTATAGQDFVDTQGTLNFADGEVSQVITVQLLEDALPESTETFSVRIDNPVGAGLLAPRTATVSIIDNDSNLPGYESFTSAAGLKLNGGASITAGTLQLTSTATRQVGSAFYNSPLSIDANRSFQSAFAFQIGGGSGAAGADGLAFVIQNDPRGTSAMGEFGGGIGYNKIQQSVAIEFDTHQNPFETAPNQISINLNGDITKPLATITSPFKLNAGTKLYAWVDYNGDSDTLAVYLSEFSQKPTLAVIKTKLELDKIVGNSAFVGFTAGNYDRPNYHRIASWTMTLDAPPSDPPLNPVGNVVKQNVVTGLSSPVAVEWSPDGRNMYIAEKGGVLKVARDGSTSATTVIDISAKVNNYQDRGMLDFALHPDFENNGYLYLLYTHDPPEVFDNVGNAYAGPDGMGNRAGQLIRVTADRTTNFTTIVPGSEVIVLGSNSTWENFNGFVDSTLNFTEKQGGLNPDGTFMRDFINSDSRSHTVGSLAFGLDGNLFVSIGDGASFNRTDPRAARVQDVNSFSGKVLRIDPITGKGLADNPFYDGDADSNRSKVYQLGFRNPWRLTVDPVTGRLFVGDTGLSSYEEINTGAPGTNFGWPYYEGGQGVNQKTPGYRDLPQAQVFYASGTVVTPALIAMQHGSGSDTIVLGDVIRDSNLGVQYEGRLLYGDLYRGIVRIAKLTTDGKLVSVESFTTGSAFVVDMRMGPDGSVYYANLVEGTVGKWTIG
ncbi:MAG: DUF4347 domain-containing protein [Planctomycetaceae bacterium]